MFKAGFVGIIGKPNAGKSSLVNKMVGEKVAIISSKPQTTRDNILGIKTGENYQIVFVDTPGVHRSKNHLDKVMMKNVRSAINGVNVIVYLIDGSKKVDEDERKYIEHLPENKIVVITKSDLRQVCDYNSDLKISSFTGENLDKLIQIILEKLPNYDKPHYLYEDGYFTDKSIKFLISEVVREKALEILHDEVPHGIAVEIIRFYETNALCEIDADIICENERHKGMIIGKGGSVLKEIGIYARKYAERLLDKKVVLKLFVRVEKDWRNKPEKIKNLGY